MFDSHSLMPHAVCWAADPALIWTMVVTNLITFLSYLTIACTLFYLVRRTGRILVRDWGYFLLGFALFILACGSTHLLEVITTWSPIFWVDAATNIVTSVLSAYVAVMLIQRVSKIAFGINDYADRLASTENEKSQIEESLVLLAESAEEEGLTPEIERALALKLAGLQTARIAGVLAELGPGAREAARRFLAGMIDAGDRDHVLRLIARSDALAVRARTRPSDAS